MRNTAFETLAGLPYFAAFFGVSLLLLTICLALYVVITPYPEIKLIREGNAAAAASLGGAIIGFARGAKVVGNHGRCSLCCCVGGRLFVHCWRSPVWPDVPAIARNVREGGIERHSLRRVSHALGLPQSASMTLDTAANAAAYLSF